MQKIKSRFWLALFSFVSFIGYFGAVFATEHTKQVRQIAEAETAYASQKSAADEARYQYYLDVANKKADFRKSMSDAEIQYNTLLKEQPGIVAQHQTKQTVTTQEPYTAQVKTSSTSSTSKPKSTRTTKTS